jgi:quercetin dioxygenase-like cupin family protein
MSSLPDDYFAAPTGEGPARPGAWYSLLATDGVPLAPGIVARPVAGEQAMVSHVTWERDGVAPVHAHHEEQLVFVVDGEIELQIGEERRVMRSGDVAVVPAFASHGGRGLAQRSVVVEAFGPPRRALLDRATIPPEL